jgi:hypothetical protein
MVTAWVFAVVLAEAAQGQINQSNQNNQIVVPVPGATMSCTREGDHLVCVVPLGKELADEPQRAADPAPKARPYKRSTPMPALPEPEALTRLKVAAANIELAKSLLPKARTPEAVVFAEQLLYWSKEQYRTAEALLHTGKEDLQRAPDPFEDKPHANNAESMAVCQADLATGCEADMP